MSTDEDSQPDRGGAPPLRYQEGPYWQDGWYWPAQAPQPPAETSTWIVPATPPSNGNGSTNGASASNGGAPANGSAAPNGSSATNGSVAGKGYQPPGYEPAGYEPAAHAPGGYQPAGYDPGPVFADGQVIDLREAPPAGSQPGARVILTDIDAAEAAAEWMRWMGFADAGRASARPDGGMDVISTGAVAQVKLHDKPALEELQRVASGRPALFFSLETYPDDVRSWGDGAGVALFRFDRLGQPEPTNIRAAELMTPRPYVATERAPVTTWSAPHQPVGPGLLVYPLLVSDAQAVLVMRRKRQGLLYNRETLAWVRQTWIPLYRIRTEFTTRSGLRGELRFASCSQLFDSIGGRPFDFKAPKNLPPLEMAGPTIVPTDARVPAAEIMNETVAIWNDYCGRDQKVALKRGAAQLTARGVPADIAHSINLELESEVLFPVFVGLLTHSSGHRLAVVDGVGGRLHAPLTAGMTANFRYLMDQLERNRYVELGPAPVYPVTG